jgi:predicted aspartyl protease
MIDALKTQVNLCDMWIFAIDQLAWGQAAGYSPSIWYNHLVQGRNSDVEEERRFCMMIDNLGRQGGDCQQTLKQFYDELARQRERFLVAVAELHDHTSGLLETYAAMGMNSEIRMVLTDLSASGHDQQKVGPSEGLQLAIRWLEQIRGQIRHETFTLHREGGVDYLDAMLNGKGSIRMVLDTGAEPTMLPERLAGDLDLKPTGRTAPCAVANGKQIIGKIMIIPSLTVGQLTVRNVVCVVIPSRKENTPPLLGQTFLRHFDYKYTQQTHRLELTKVEPDEPIKQSEKKRYRNKSHAIAPKSQSIQER